MTHRALAQSTTLYAVALTIAVGCSSAPSASPDASARPAASAKPAAPPPPAVTCDTVSERAGGSPTRHIDVPRDGASVVLATYQGTHAMTVASAITSSNFLVADPLGTPIAPDTKVRYIQQGAGVVRHPNVTPPRNMLDANRARVDLAGELFVVLVNAEGSVTRYVPALDEREARAMGALLAKDSCAPRTSP